MQLCTHFADPARSARCSAGVRYQTLAGGGVFSMVMRLPCLPLSNRHGEEVRACEKFLAIEEKEVL